jgi:signal transduction histidine kinase
MKLTKGQTPETLNIASIMTPLKGVITGGTKLESLLSHEDLKSDGILVVVDASGKLLGTLGPNELMVAIEKKSSDLTAREIMAPPRETLLSSASHHDACQAFIRSHLQYVVVTENDKPAGILWASHSLAAMTQSYRSIFEEFTLSQEKVKYRDDFLGILLHDIRSPLGAMSACCDLIKLQSKDLPKSHLNLIDTIKRNIDRCVSLASDLLDFGKLNDGINVNLEIVEIHSVLDELTHNLKLIGNQKYGVTLSTDWCGSIGIQVDRTRFGQIIDNLVINAFKVTPRGKNVYIKTMLVDDFKRHNKSLRFDIIDEGPGIPANQLKTIFDKYTQLDNHQNEASGVGLGLSIVAQFVRLHNGDIYVDGGGEDTGLGATFSVSIPNASILRVDSLREAVKGLVKLLIVDDDEDIRETLVDAFRGLPYEIRTAIDGEQGFSLFSTWNPDLVISDMRMPKKTGLELFHDIRSVNDKTGLILVSGALEDFSDINIKSAFKPDGFLAKPFVSADLVGMVAKILKRD